MDIWRLAEGSGGGGDVVVLGEGEVVLVLVMVISSRVRFLLVTATGWLGLE